MPSFSIRSIDGSDTIGGRAGSPLVRKTNNTDQFDSRPNPRSISNACSRQEMYEPPEHDEKTGYRLNDAFWAWGQFLDHDIGLTPSDQIFGEDPIPILDENDPIGKGSKIPFVRSMFEEKDGQRIPVNMITPLIDGSAVYGSTPERVLALRTLENGKLKVTMDPHFGNASVLPPINTNNLENDNGHTGQEMFLLGDLRGNEHVGLTAMHTLFIREHNRLCDEILAKYPDATDEEVFQLSRKVVAAQIQKVTYEEWLPVLLGHRTVRLSNNAYRPGTNVNLAVEFSTAAFRFGHTMVGSGLKLVSPRGNDRGKISLRAAFFNPDYLRQNHRRVDMLLHGLLEQQAQDIDPFLIDDVRNFLFGNPGSGGMDLAAINIQRGRDHGIPSYNDVRVAYGLPRRNSWREVNRDVKMQKVLEQTFGTPDNMDAWVGCLAERKAPNSYVGPLVAKILREQFSRLMWGDRLFYLHDKDLNSNWVRPFFDIHTFKFTDLIRRNTWNSIDEQKAPFQM